jgi:hypothetical protein
MSQKENERNAALPLMNSVRPNSNELGPEASENAPLPWNPHLHRPIKVISEYIRKGG